MATAGAITRPAFLPVEQPGDLVGRYKLLEKLGEGGCGAVYLAEQEEPVRRRVALKVIKLGMDTKEVIARFDAERQALALMDHPNIAKVFDGGATTSGRPFFVMELVRGVPITKYCDEQNLSTTARLELFIQVCHAIQHAHQKGIIHRDIKPSNIFVACQDDLPVPKVIDFGIAKATAGRLTDQTLFTAFEQFIGTPAYMSPEQAELSGLDIDTRSDIYSLGVLLYELLTGRPPFDPKSLVEAGLDEVRRILREVEPPRPSTRLSTLTDADRSSVARQRGTDPGKLSLLLRGDLDWIAMRCLEKDRARRYETANGLAEDIQRHLSNEPVAARPPSVAYRIQKFVRRNRLACAAVVAVVASLVGGLSISTVLYLREAEQKRRADDEAAIARAVNTFLQHDLLRQTSSTSQEFAGFVPEPNLTVRQALDRAAERIAERFKKQPLVEASIQQTIGSAYLSVGESEKAREHLERALALQLANQRPHSLEIEQTLDSLKLIAVGERFAQGVSKPVFNLPLFEESLQRLKSKLGPDHPDTIAAMLNLASACLGAGERDREMALLEEALAQRKTKLGSDHPDTLKVMDSLAWAYQRAGKSDQARSLREEVFTRRKAQLGLDHSATLGAMITLASHRLGAGQHEQAVPLLEEALKRSRAGLGAENLMTRQVMDSLAFTYMAVGKTEQALILREESFSLAKAAYGPGSSQTFIPRLMLASAYQTAGRPDRALPLLEESVELRRALDGPKHPGTLGEMDRLADCYRQVGKLDQALRIDEESLKLQKASLEAPRPDAQINSDLAKHYERVGDLSQAVPLLEENLKLSKEKYGPEHPDSVSALIRLAAAYGKQNDRRKQVSLYRELVAILAKTAPDTLNTASWQSTLGSLLCTEREYADAEPLLRAALATREKKSADDWGTFQARSHLGHALLGQGKYTEAEPLLVSGYEGMKQREAQIPALLRITLHTALSYVVQLYRALGVPDKTSEWQQKLDEAKGAEASAPPVIPRPAQSR